MNANIRLTKQSIAFLETLPPRDRQTFEHEAGLIVDGYSADFMDVRNEYWHRVAQAKNLSDPKRLKIMCIANQRGGIRAIFAFSLDRTPRLMFIFKIDYRDADIYMDGR